MGAALLMTAAEAGSTKAAELDGELLDLCAEYVALERASRAEWEALETEEQMQAHYRTKPLPWTEEARNAPDKVLMREIARLPARTPEGVRAKAGVLVWLYGGDDQRTPAEWDQEEPLFSLLRDLTGRARS